MMQQCKWQSPLITFNSWTLSLSESSRHPFHNIPTVKFNQHELSKLWNKIRDRKREAQTLRLHVLSVVWQKKRRSSLSAGRQGVSACSLSAEQDLLLFCQTTLSTCRRRRRRRSSWSASRYGTIAPCLLSKISSYFTKPVVEAFSGLWANIVCWWNSSPNEKVWFIFIDWGMNWI